MSAHNQPASHTTYAQVNDILGDSANAFTMQARARLISQRVSTLSRHVSVINGQGSSELHASLQFPSPTRPHIGPDQCLRTSWTSSQQPQAYEP